MKHPHTVQNNDRPVNLRCRMEVAVVHSGITEIGWRTATSRQTSNGASFAGCVIAARLFGNANAVSTIKKNTIRQSGKLHVDRINESKCNRTEGTRAFTQSSTNTCNFMLLKYTWSKLLTTHNLRPNTWTCNPSKLVAPGDANWTFIKNKYKWTFQVNKNERSRKAPALITADSKRYSASDCGGA